MMCFGMPLAMGRVPPNPWYGYRIDAFVMEDEEIWYEVNRKGGNQIVYCATSISVLAAVSSVFVGKPEAQFAFAVFTVFALFFFFAFSIGSTLQLSESLARRRGLCR